MMLGVSVRYNSREMFMATNNRCLLWNYFSVSTIVCCLCVAQVYVREEDITWIYSDYTCNANNDVGSPNELVQTFIRASQSLARCNHSSLFVQCTTVCR